MRLTLPLSLPSCIFKWKAGKDVADTMSELQKNFEKWATTNLEARYSFEGIADPMSKDANSHYWSRGVSLAWLGWRWNEELRENK